MKLTETRLTVKLGALVVTAATAACASAIDMQFMKEIVATRVCHFIFRKVRFEPMFTRVA